MFYININTQIIFTVMRDKEFDKDAPVEIVVDKKLPNEGAVPPTCELSKYNCKLIQAQVLLN